MADRTRRLLGLTLDGREPIFEAKPAHSLLLAGPGSGKTVAGTMIWILSLIRDLSRAMVITDSKQAELAMQLAAMLVVYDRKLAIVDDGYVMGRDNPYRVSLNPFGGIVEAYKARSGDLVFALENAVQALIEEPSGGPDRNLHFRDSPRRILSYLIRSLLARNPDLATPGAVATLLADTELIARTARIDREEGDEGLRDLAQQIVDMEEDSNWRQHLNAARNAVRLYGPESPLHEAGSYAEITHHRLIAEKYITFIVGSQAHIDRMGPHYGLHVLSFKEALMTGSAGGVHFVLEEMTNAPLRPFIASLTTMRGYGGSAYMVAQGRGEIERRFGKLELQTIEENTATKLIFGVNSFADAETWPRAIGEARTVGYGLGVDSGRLDISGNLSTGRQRLIAADELLRMPRDQFLMHIQGVGFARARKLYQNQVAPYCFDLACNALEGGRLEPDPKVWLPVGDAGPGSHRTARSGRPRRPWWRVWR